MSDVEVLTEPVMDEKSPGAWEPGSQRPDQKLYYDIAAKSRSGQAI